MVGAVAGPADPERPVVVRKRPRNRSGSAGSPPWRDRVLWAVGGLAFGLRAIWVFAFARIPEGLSDPFLYHGYAIRLANGRGYQSLVDEPTAYYPPGYPFFLGGIYEVVDLLGLDHQLDTVVGLAQSLLWATAAVAVVLMARWAFDGEKGRRVGLVAGVVLACWPNLVTYAAAWLSESLFVALFAVSVAALTHAARIDSTIGAHRAALVVAGLATGAATMVRPQVLLGLPLVALAWLLSGLGWRRVLLLAASLAAGVAVFVVPWTIRNASVMGEAVPVSTNGGDNLCIGFHPGARGSFQFPIEYCDTGEFWNDGPDAELRRNADTRQLAMDYITSEPLSLPWLSARKLFYTYRSDDDGLVAGESYGATTVLDSPWRGTWLTFAHTAYAPIMLMAAAGLVLAARTWWRDRRLAGVAALLGLALAGLFVPVLFFGDPRFKVPATPLLAVFAALAGVTLARALARRRGGTAKSWDRSRT
jgi:4-amino-4-deoxy-L-arabinose transferase-like glycosyltransferase